MNIALKFAFTMIFVMLLALPVRAGNGVAKVIILKGNVLATNADGSKEKLRKGMWIKEGSTVETQAKSFAKLLFIDKSSMNVGPNSEMKIKEFPKSEAGIIQLMNGQISSKVTKDYMNMKDKNKSKLFIKTKTAAMGVRGTDFQVNYNPINEATSLVTFEGNVAMAQLTNLGNMDVTQSNLEKVVSSDQAVEVKKGQYAGASPKTPRATTPIKISPVQLNTLKASQVPGVSAAEGSSTGEGSDASAKKAPPPPAPKKTFRNVIPPGVDAKTFSNDSKELDGAMNSSVGAAMVKEVKQDIAREVAASNAPPPEGSVNSATGEIAPPAGGFIDLGTAQYVPPPPGSQYDENAGVFIPPPSLGSVDPETGGFKNDHYDLTPDGKFVPKPVDEIASNDAGGPNDRGPASAGDSSTGTETEGGPKSEGPPKDGGPNGNPANSANSANPDDKGGSIDGPPPPGSFVGGPAMATEFSADAPPPPPPEIAIVSVIGMDSSDMAEFEAQLAPPPPPPEMKLDMAPPPEDTAAFGPGPNGSHPPANGDGSAPGTTAATGPATAANGGPNPPPIGPDGSVLPPPPGEFNGDPAGDFAGNFGDHPPPEFDSETFENIANDLAENIVNDITDDFEANQEQIDQINNERTNVEFIINVQ